MVRKHPEGRAHVSARAVFVPMMWIVVLLASYWVLAGWPSVPGLITATFAAI